MPVRSDPNVSPIVELTLERAVHCREEAGWRDPRQADTAKSVRQVGQCRSALEEVASPQPQHRLLRARVFRQSRLTGSPSVAKQALPRRTALTMSRTDWLGVWISIDGPMPFQLMAGSIVTRIRVHMTQLKNGMSSWMSSRSQIQAYHSTSIHDFVNLFFSLSYVAW